MARNRKRRNRRKGKTKETPREREERIRYETFEQTMDLVLDAIAFGVYQYFQDMQQEEEEERFLPEPVFQPDDEENIPPRYTKRRKRKKKKKKGSKHPKVYVYKQRHSKIPENRPGISCCHHGVYECPKCVEERKKKKK